MAFGSQGASAGLSNSAKVGVGILQGSAAVGSAVNDFRSAGATITASDFDTKLAALRAQDAITRGNTEARMAELQTAGVVGKARTALAASGVQVSGGTAADIQVQDAGIGAFDAQMIRNNAAREAMGYTTDAALNALGARSRATALQQEGVETLATGAAKTYGLFAKTKVPGGGNMPSIAQRTAGYGDDARSDADSP